MNRPDVIHAGAGYTECNLRFHVYVENHSRLDNTRMEVAKNLWLYHRVADDLYEKGQQPWMPLDNSE
jgi:hypothetical protein